MRRGGGVLMHISSLPGPFGIGVFGEEAVEFAKKLSAQGMKYCRRRRRVSPVSERRTALDVSLCFPWSSPPHPVVPSRARGSPPASAVPAAVRFPSARPQDPDRAQARFRVRPLFFPRSPCRLPHGSRYPSVPPAAGRSRSRAPTRTGRAHTR